MKYTPDTIATADMPVARLHGLGGEKRLYATRAPALEYGELFFAGDGSGVWTPDPINALPAGGVDLCVKVSKSLRADAAVALLVVGTDQNSALLSGTATFNPPSWARNKRYDFQEGVALDVSVTATKRFKTITSVTATNAKKGSRLLLFALPEATDWDYIEKVQNVTPKVGTSPGVAIAENMDGASEVTKGRSPVSELTISANRRSVADGLERFAGDYACFRLDILKQEKVLVERQVFANAVLQVDPDFPDGSEEVKDAASGIFADYFGFYAP